VHESAAADAARVALQADLPSTDSYNLTANNLLRAYASVHYRSLKASQKLRGSLKYQGLVQQNGTLAFKLGSSVDLDSWSTTLNLITN
jgi:hypothetical protein